MTKKILDFIHVGDYKTGTTWLQRSVLSFHSEIEYLGDVFKKKELQEVLRELVDVRDLDFDAKKLRKKFTKNLNKGSKKIYGISREALSQSNYITGENAKRNAVRLKEVFGNVKIIYVIREQISMLGSIYNQYLKTGGTRNFKDWFLDPVECNSIIERLKYDKNVEMYCEIFGKKNVLVLLFEELKYDPENFLKKFYTFIGCKNTNFKLVKNNKILNPSLNETGAFFSKKLHKLFRNSYHNYRSTFLGIDKLIYILLPKKTLDKLDKKTQTNIINTYGKLDKKQRIMISINMGIMHRITKICEKIKIGKKIKVPEDVVEKLLPFFKQSNKILSKKYHLDVNKFDWSL